MAKSKTPKTDIVYVGGMAVIFGSWMWLMLTRGMKKD